MNVSDQYSPKRDRLRVQILQVLAVLVAMLLIMAFAAALYKLDQSRTYDDDGIRITSSEQTSTYIDTDDHGSTRPTPDYAR